MPGLDLQSVLKADNSIAVNGAFKFQYGTRTFSGTGARQAQVSVTHDLGATPVCILTQVRGAENKFSQVLNMNATTFDLRVRDDTATWATQVDVYWLAIAIEAGG